ncbi:hypothetical protein KIW84_050651 [Lathyrus oleraceus]|uniref:Uncharacterized protein n=1 Tax=Pisum sativum TaxID=3888 RepID=A0A9D5ACQ9_PEA|nr:hypothetical protein KIW84_050651 [Pisum sativum]
MEEIRQAVFNLNTNSSPWPGMVPPHYNANNVILIPKSSNADTLPQFRPIVMANFKFKIISKVLVDKLVLIIPGIISEEQRAGEVLSRSTTNLVNSGNLKLIKGTRKNHVQSHVLYSYDFMIFCTVTPSNLLALADFFDKYG